MYPVAIVGEGLLIAGLLAIVVLIPVAALICALVALAGGARRREQCVRLEESLRLCLERLRLLEARPRQAGTPDWAQPSAAPKAPPQQPKPESVRREHAAPLPPPPAPVRADIPALARTAKRTAPPPSDAERWEGLEGKLGKQWMTWVGAVVLMLSAGFLVKYAFDHNWLSPGLRVLCGVLIGLATGAAGERFLRRDMRALGQGLVGTGIAVAMIALYAAYGPYDVLSRGFVFASMALVGLAGMGLALRHDSPVIAVLATLGGFIIPVMLRTGIDPRDALFAYVLLLDVGVLAVAYFKRWRGLPILALAGTWGYFAGWYGIHYEAAAALPASVWVGAFYAVFAALSFLYCLRRREAITGDRFAMTIVNVMLAFGWAYMILHDDHQHMLGLATSAMAASFLVLGALTRRRTPSSGPAVFSFLAIAVALFTIAVPIHFSFHVVTIAWAIEAPFLLYLAYRHDYLPVRIGSVALLLLAAARLFTIDWPMHTESFTLLLNGSFLSAILVACAGAVYAQIHWSRRPTHRRVDRLFEAAVGVGSGLLALVLLNIEFWQWLQFAGRADAARWTAMLLCSAGALGFLVAGVLLRSAPARIAGLAPLAFVLLFGLADYSAGAEEARLIFGNPRFLAALFGTGVAFLYAGAWRRPDLPCTVGERNASAGILAWAIVLLTALIGVELWQGLTLGGHVYAARCLAPLVVLGGAVACMAFGVRLRSRTLRGTGLTLLPAACVLAAWPFTLEMHTGYILLVNGRFLAALATVAAVFGFARGVWHADDAEERAIARMVLVAGVAALFALLNVETYRYFQVAVAGDQRAAWIAQMSLTILWGVYATAMLLIGFRRNVRAMRLSALALFASAVLKLVLVDMASIEGLYRILAFLVLGSLMIGVSYVYHRVEKRLLGEASASDYQTDDRTGRRDHD
jgi:uncharacterized membrane protein